VHAANQLSTIAGLLACPWCGGGLSVGSAELTCQACARVYPIRQGIALLARIGTPDERHTQKTGPPAASSLSYQQQYEDVAEATKYNEGYKKLSKMINTTREHSVLNRLLKAQPRSATLLDLPAGGGRLSPALEQHTDLLIEADAALGQLLYGAADPALKKTAARMTASAFHIPLRSGAVDATVCCRLSHHLPTAAERERLVAELLRVSKRFVIMTFFDHDSHKNRRRLALGKPSKLTMTVSQVAELANRGGAELVAQPAMFPFFSGHRYAVMVKRKAV
jgi:SAM-dependent methyltransferase